MVAHNQLSFVDQVQRGQTQQPTQKSFTLSRWQQAFLAIQSPTLEDQRLYDAGVWAFHKFEAIRNTLERTSPIASTVVDTIRMHLGEANRNLHILEERAKPDDDYFIAEQIVQAKLDRLQPFGGTANPDALLISSIDSLRFSLQRTYHADFQQQETLIGIDDLAAVEELKLVTILAQLYNIIDGYWMHALWNNWYVESTDEIDVITPFDGVQPIIAAISDYRRSALMIETIFHFDREWVHQITDAGRSILTAMLPKIEEDGDPQNWKVTSRGELDGGTKTLFVNRLRAERGYYQELIHEPIDDIKPITLHMLLTSWEVLYCISENLLAEFPPMEDSGVYSIEKLLRYAPTLDKRQITRLIGQWCNCGDNIAKQIVEFFCYRKNTKWEIWGHPLIELDKDIVAVALTPIRQGNMERTIELWMKDGGLKLAQKGAHFEQYVKAELRLALQSSERLTDGDVVANNVRINTADTEEEIDLVIRIGNIILIGEAKCILFPSDPIEVARYFHILYDAVAQAQRKADFARKNLQQLLDSAGLAPKVPVETLVLHPFVIVNQPFGAGFSINGVPVTDELIWKRYFEGKYDQLVRSTAEGELEAERTVDLYSNDKDAAEQIRTYLDDPPQLRHYRRYLTAGIERFPRIDSNDRYFAAKYLEVSLPFPDLVL